MLKRVFGHYRFNSITRRIIVLNFFGVAILVAGSLYLNQYRVRFMETRVESLTTQAEIIASAIGKMSKNSGNSTGESGQSLNENRIVVASALANPELSFAIDPELIAPMLRVLAGPTKTRARVFDNGGALVADSQALSPRGQGGKVYGPLSGPDALSRVWTYGGPKFGRPICRFTRIWDQTAKPTTRCALR